MKDVGSDSITGPFDRVVFWYFFLKLYEEIIVANCTASTRFYGVAIVEIFVIFTFFEMSIHVSSVYEEPSPS